MAGKHGNWVLAGVLMVLATASGAQDRAAYDQRNVARYLETFRMLDRDADRIVTLAESQGDLNFLPTFNDMDIDRDGSVTEAELHRYLTLVHRMQPVAVSVQAPPPPPGTAAPR